MKALFHLAMRHRVVLAPGAEVEGLTTHGVLDQILLRVNSIKVIGSGNRTSYADTLGGEPTYKVGQVVWDQAIKWSICR